MTDFSIFQLILLKVFSFTFYSSSSGGRGIARTCVAVIVIIMYVTFSLTYCDLFQSICYVVNKRFFTISVCFRSIETKVSSNIPESIEETCLDTPETNRDGKEPFANNITYALKEITIGEAKGDMNNNDYNSSVGPGDKPCSCSSSLSLFSVLSSSV